MKSIILYGSEVWGWKEREKIESIQIQYIKWTLGLDKRTPIYIVLEETKRNKMEVETGDRAMKYEERLRLDPKRKILSECWKEIRIQEEGRITQNKWLMERRRFYERNG